MALPTILVENPNHPIFLYHWPMKVSVKTIYKFATKFFDLFPQSLRERIIWLLQASLGMRVLEDLSEEIRLGSRLLSNMEAPVAIDIGANVGAWSLGILGNLSNIRVVCFEPNSGIVLQKLKEHPRANVINKAISNQIGTMTLFLVEDEAGGSGMASLHNRNLGAFTSLEVEVIALDDSDEVRHLDKIDFIKIDAEGHEMFVLDGAINVIRENRPFVQFEYGGAWIDSKRYLREAFKYFEASSYSLFRINRGKLFGPLAYSEDLENFRFANYVAISDEKLGIASNLRF